MQVPATSAASPTAIPVVATLPARIVSGDLTTIPLGTPLQATVSSVTPQNAVLTVNGQTLTVRPPPGTQLQPGAVLLVRVPATAANATNPALELSVPPNSAQTPQTPTAATLQVSAGVTTALTNTVARSTGSATTPATTPAAAPSAKPAAPAAAPPRLAVVDVLATLPDGRVRVQIDGEEQTATPSEPLATGGRYVLQVSQTSSGLALKPPPDSPTLPTDVAIAVLRTPAPTLAAALKPLQAELAALAGKPTATVQPTTTTLPTTTTQPTTATPLADSVPPTVATLLVGGVQPTTATLPAATTPTTAIAQLAGTIQTLAVFKPTTAAQTTATPADGTAQPAPAPAPTPVSVAPAPATASTANGTALTTNATVQKAANAVLATLSTFISADSRPPNATELQNLIENGGLHYEAKLARLGTEPAAPAAPTTTASTTGATKPATSAAAVPASNPSATAAAASGATATPTPGVGPDLKGDLLRLLQSVQDLGGTGAAAAAPATQAALGGIEVQQATNALAQATGAPYYLQVPFPDGAVWRTLHLSLEPQNPSNQSDASPSGRFRVFMHVPLTDLGETWIDAGVAGTQLRATIYLDQPAVQSRVQAALPDLQTELQADGFSEVLLNVKSSSDLPDRYRREAGAMQAGRPASVSLLDVRA